MGVKFQGLRLPRLSLRLQGLRVQKAQNGERLGVRDSGFEGLGLMPSRCRPCLLQRHQKGYYRAGAW